MTTGQRIVTAIFLALFGAVSIGGSALLLLQLSHLWSFPLWAVGMAIVGAIGSWRGLFNLTGHL